MKRKKKHQNAAQSDADLTEGICAHERILLELLRGAIGKGKVTRRNMSCDWEQILNLAQAHAVSALLYDDLSRLDVLAPDLEMRLKKDAQSTVLANYRLLFLTAYLTEYFEKQHIKAITLKGAAAAALYPVPEYRKSGDVDLLISRADDYKRALHLLHQAGFRDEKEQTALHHKELRNKEGICVELHHTLTEPFPSKKLNAYINKLMPGYAKYTTVHTEWGLRLLQPANAYTAFYLILHMLQHFLREGFGLKNLYDWTLFWDQDIAGAEKASFLKMVRESGTKRFVQVVTAACVRYCGLSKEKVSFLLTEPIGKELVAAFMREVLDAGEFGRSQADRMVAMQGTGIAAYLHEFHHQMHLNYPKAGRVVLCWPLLWMLTFTRFLYNNYRLRRAPVRSILKKARSRSKLMKQLRLFS